MKSCESAGQDEGLGMSKTGTILIWRMSVAHIP